MHTWRQLLKLLRMTTLTNSAEKSRQTIYQTNLMTKEIKQLSLSGHWERMRAKNSKRSCKITRLSLRSDYRKTSALAPHRLSLLRKRTLMGSCHRRYLQLDSSRRSRGSIKDSRWSRRFQLKTWTNFLIKDPRIRTYPSYWQWTSPKTTILRPSII